MKIDNRTPFVVDALPFPGPEDRPVLTVMVKGTFTILPDAPAATADAQLPLAYADELLDEEKPGSLRFAADAVPFKPRADVALLGKAHVPPGKKTRALDVSLRVGKLKKVIRIFGDRRWNCAGRFSPATISKAGPFSEMELVYERAYGGIDLVSGGYFAHNPAGVGYFVKKRRKAVDGAPLPNLEDPDDLIRSWKSRPKPAGFGFYAPGWQPRAGCLGTYDEKWRRQRSPLPPADFRWEFHNAAHPDLQLKAYLQGNEEVELIFLSPGHERLRFWLPGLTPHCAIELEGPPDHGAPAQEPAEEADNLSDLLDEADLADAEATLAPGEADDIPPEPHLPLQLDTLCLLPEEGLLYLVWRGLQPLRDLIPTEVKTVTIW
jgi:hypothetical protein